METKASKESSLVCKIFEVCVFHGLKRVLRELIKNNRKVPLWEIPRTFGNIPMKVRKQPVKVRALRNMKLLLLIWALCLCIISSKLYMYQGVKLKWVSFPSKRLHCNV